MSVWLLGSEWLYCFLRHGRCETIPLGGGGLHGRHDMERCICWALRIVGRGDLRRWICVVMRYPPRLGWLDCMVV